MLCDTVDSEVSVCVSQVSASDVIDSEQESVFTEEECYGYTLQVALKSFHACSANNKWSHTMKKQNIKLLMAWVLLSTAPLPRNSWQNLRQNYKFPHAMLTVLKEWHIKIPQALFPNCKHKEQRFWHVEQIW